MLRLLASRAPTGARFFHSSGPALSSGSTRRTFKGRNARVRKKLKKVHIRYGDTYPHVMAKRKEDLRRVELLAQFKEIENVPVIHWKPPILQAWVLNLQDASPVSIMPLNRKVWGAPIRKDVVHRVVRYHRAMWQQGTHKSKKRPEVSGGGRKPRPQKGMGMAQLGSTRSSHCQGGGKAWGPVHRSHAHKLNLKFLKMGMRVALSAKYAEGNMFVIKDTMLDSHKTAPFLEIVQKHWPKIEHSTIAVLHTWKELDPNLALAARNFWNFDFYTPRTANVYDLVKRHHLIVTESAIEGLEYKLTNNGLRGKIHFPVDRPLVKLADCLPHRFGRQSRKQLRAMTEQKAKKDRAALMVKVKAYDAGQAEMEA